MSRVALFSLCAGLWLSCSTAEAPPPPVNQFHQALTEDEACTVTIAADRELLIRELAVVEDPVRTRWTGGTANSSDGAWAFGRLMATMAGPSNASAFVRSWLASWETTQLVNGFPVPARPSLRSLVTDPWLAASGGASLDLTRAPFRLLAIVNRMDLADLPNGSAGEGRFVFGVLDPSGFALQFTVILEYRLPAANQADVDRWAADWHALGSLPPGSPAFNAALEAITNRFAGANAAPGRINGSAINQVRTNEIALTAPWELREFRLSATGQLVETPVMQTADLSLNGSPTLSNFVNTNQVALLAGSHVVPATFQGAPFQAGASLTPPGFFWSAPGIVDNEARFRFSVNTCNGCHAGETGTAFLHIAPRQLGTVSALSGVLTGRTQPDPVTGVPRTFNDLAARAEALKRVICAASAPGPLTITITAPVAGAGVSGLVTLAASVSAPASSVQFFVDGLAVGPPLLTAPFTMLWDSRAAPLGNHSVTALAFDSAGSSVASPPVAFLTVPTNAPDFTIT